MSEVNTIFKVWGKQEGWVRLPRKMRDPSASKGPKNNKGEWQEQMFRWPQDDAKIVDWIKDSHANKYDIYWCPSVFTKPQGIQQNIKQMTCLYADLDEKNPETLPANLRPTMAWESSPNRYAGIWELDEPISPVEGAKLNKNLTYYIGADKGGWDLTQVLRIPGTRNYKYANAPKGKLLWYDEKPLNSSKFRELPGVEMTELEEREFDQELIESETSLLPGIVRPYLSKLDTSTLELLFTPEDEAILEDRSSRLWELECKLLESGVPKEKVIKLVAASAWNKYKGRKDETKRLVTEVNKAAETVDIPDERGEGETRGWTSYEDLMGQEMTQPGWMIEGVWQKTSHGMISGEPKTYKSVIASDMIVSVASGTDFMGKFPVRHEGPVLVIQEENDPWLVKDRIAKIANSRGLFDGEVKQIDNHRFRIKFPPVLPINFLNNKGFDLTSQEDRKFLEEAVAEAKPVLIVFDPLYLMMGGKDENSSKDIRPMLSWLLKLRYVYKASVIVIHHWNKNGKSERGGQRMLGSVLFHGWVESAMYTSVINEDQHQICIDREFRSFSKPTKLDVTFRFGEPGELYYEPKLSDLVDNTADAVYDFMKGSGRVSEIEVKEALSMSKAQVKQRLAALKKDGKIKQDGDLWVAIKKEEGNEQGD